MKYKYNIKNLDCANCAKTIENKLNEDKNIKKAIVNFNSSTVTVETDLKDAFTYIKKIVSEIEPDAILSEDKIKEIKLNIFKETEYEMQQLFKGGKKLVIDYLKNFKIEKVLQVF